MSATHHDALEGNTGHRLFSPAVARTRLLAGPRHSQRTDDLDDLFPAAMDHPPWTILLRRGKGLLGAVKKYPAPLWPKSVINCNQAKTSDPFRIPTFVGQNLLDNQR